MIFFIFYKFVFFFPDFLEIQRKNFYSFLKLNLGKEFKKMQPFINVNLKKKSFKKSSKSVVPISLYFFYNNYKFTSPEISVQESIISYETYSCKFFMPVRIYHSLANFNKVKWIFLGTLPLLTKRGNFIINGTPKIILNQIIRNPGVYFNKDISKKNSRKFYAEIISKRGPWIKLEIDNKRKVWVDIKQNEETKIPLKLFFQKFFKKYIDNLVSINNIDVFNAKNNNGILKNYYDENNALFSSSIKSSDLIFDLGKYGRIQLNKKLGLSINTPNLTPTDFLVINNLLLKLSLNKINENVIDDIDDLKNRRIKGIDELLQNQVSIGLIRMQKIFINIFKKKKNLKLINTEKKNVEKILDKVFLILNDQPISNALKEFFNSHQLSQYLDQTNPLSEITHKRRISCLGAGGISKDNASMQMRSIHFTYYGRICPIETPEGKNAGLVNSLTAAANINKQGFIQTPYINVYKRQIQNQNKIFWFSAENQEMKNIFFNSKLPNFKNVSVGVIKSQLKNFNKSKINNVELIATSAQQFISIATSFIPFIEHNDANRALMGSNMQRQALPLIDVEQPLVTTLNSFKILCDLQVTPTSKKTGVILYSSKKKVYIYTVKKILFNKLYKSNKFLKKIIFKYV